MASRKCYGRHWDLNLSQGNGAEPSLGGGGGRIGVTTQVPHKLICPWPRTSLGSALLGGNVSEWAKINAGQNAT